MARIVRITCSGCGQEKEVGTSGSLTPTTCNECRDEQKARQKREYLEARGQLSIERRIALLEEEAYDHDQLAHGYTSPAAF